MRYPARQRRLLASSVLCYQQPQVVLRQTDGRGHRSWKATATQARRVTGCRYRQETCTTPRTRRLQIHGTILSSLCGMLSPQPRTRRHDLKTLPLRVVFASKELGMECQPHTMQERRYQSSNLITVQSWTVRMQAKPARQSPRIQQ